MSASSRSGGPKQLRRVAEEGLSRLGPYPDPENVDRLTEAQAEAAAQFAERQGGICPVYVAGVILAVSVGHDGPLDEDFHDALDWAFARFMRASAERQRELSRRDSWRLRPSRREIGSYRRQENLAATRFTLRHRDACGPQRSPRAPRRTSGRPRARRARSGSSSRTSGSDPGNSEGGDGDPPSAAQRSAQTDLELNPALAAVLADPDRDAHLWRAVGAWAEHEIDLELGGEA